MPLQFRFLERGPPFPSRVYYSFFSQKSSLIPKFEKAFEAIMKNERDYKETLKRYSFRKPRRHACSSEQVGLVFISDFEEN